jgi:hypothetical protein
MIFKKIGNMEDVEVICHYFESKSNLTLKDRQRAILPIIGNCGGRKS